MIQTFDIELDKKQIKISTGQSVKGNIVYYGNDNQYPSNMESIMDGSETAMLCIATETKFTSTDFTNPEIGKLSYGRNWFNRPYTLNQIKREIAESMAKFNGAYLMVNRDLKGNVVTLNVLDFTKCRFAEFDDTMRSTGIWYGDFSKEIKGKKGKSNFTKFPLYSPDYNTYKSFAEAYGTTASIYPIFYNTSYYYPESPYESVIYDMLTEREIQVNRFEEITQGTPAKLVIRTDISTDEIQRQAEIEQIKQFAGSKGDRVLIISTSFDEDGNPIDNGYALDTIQDTRDLSKFSDAEDRLEKNIRKCVQIPSILVSPNDGATIDGSAAQMEAAIAYYNDITKSKRQIISDSLTEILGFDCSMVDFGQQNKEEI